MVFVIAQNLVDFEQLSAKQENFARQNFVALKFC